MSYIKYKWEPAYIISNGNQHISFLMMVYSKSKFADPAITRASFLNTDMFRSLYGYLNVSLVNMSHMSISHTKKRNGYVHHNLHCNIEHIKNNFLCEPTFCTNMYFRRQVTYGFG